MTQERRDKRLMLDMLRSPATLFFRDDHIAIIQPVGADSYNFYSPVPASAWQRNGNLENVFVVRTNSKEYFLVRKSAGMAGGVFEFGSSAYLDAHVGNGEFDTIKLYKRTIEEYLKKYPSLRDAFGEMAEQMCFLPMIEKQTDAQIWEALEHNLQNIHHIKNLTYKRKVKILTRWPGAIKTIGQTQELCDLLVKEDGANIRYLDQHFLNQKLCERAVANYASALQYVPNQTEKICLIAIKRDAMALKHVRNPTMKILVAAVNRSPDAWNLIKKEKLRREVRKAKKQKKYQT